MLLSSGRSQRWSGRFLVGGAVAEHRPEGGAPSSGEGDECLLVVLRIGVLVESLADLLVELSDRSVDDGDLLRELGDELRAHRLGPKHDVLSVQPRRLRRDRRPAQHAASTTLGFKTPSEALAEVLR